MISIIVPVYNVEEYIGKCLDSILSQDYVNIEVICVNDGSTDNSGKILDEYALRDNRIKVFHKENGGVSSARNLALENATGDYIGFVDSDDYVSPDMYSSLMNALKSNGADIAECSIAYVEENGDIKRVVSRKYVLCNQNDIQKAFFLKDIGIINCTKLFKSDIAKTQRFNEKYMIGEDSLFLYNCLKNTKKIVGIDTVGYYYLQRGSSVMHNILDERKLNFFEIVDSWLDETKNDNKIYRAAVKRDCILSVMVLDAALKTNADKKYIKNARKRILRHKWIVFTSRYFSFRFKLGALFLWLCPKMHYKIKR